MPETYPRRFGPFVLVMPLARGGMGHVALALTADGQPCVVKRMLPELQRDAEHRARFGHEGKLSLSLAHRNLVETLAAGEVDGEPYLAQRYLDGKTLGEVQTRLAADFAIMPVAVAVHIAAEVASGLAYAHGIAGLDLVHRDISPPNIRLGASGKVRLLDFGMASSAQRNFQTEPGGAWGKLVFMAPELFRGAKADRRADIYALGVVLWEMLTGRAYGSAVKPDGTVVQPSLGGWGAGPPEGWQAPAPSRINREVPPALDAVVARALARAPEERFPSATELRAALLAAAAAGAAGPAVPAGPASASGEAAVAALLGRLFDLPHAALLRHKAMDEARPLLVEAAAAGVPATALAAAGDVGGPLVPTSGAAAGGAPIAGAGALPTTSGASHATAQLPRAQLRPALVAAALTAVIAFTATGLFYSFRGRPQVAATVPVTPRATVASTAPPASPPPIPKPATPAPAPSSPSPTAVSPPAPPTPATVAVAPPSRPSPAPGSAPAQPAAPPTHAGHTPSGPRARSSAPAPGVATTPVRLLEQARTAYALDALDEALRLGSAAASLGGGADAHALVGNIHMKRSSLDEAERAYRAALAADPKHRIAAERLGRLRALREQRTGARP